ncbi:hypothetical protein G6F56_005189 [Rhizopus delemar]|nr:hypothetical protein G6F56_005189 [Rhizopus delemar]
MLTQNEITDMTQSRELCAAIRQYQPPEVASVPYIIPTLKEREKQPGQKPTVKRNVTRKQAQKSDQPNQNMERHSTPIASTQPIMAHQPIQMDTDLPILSQKPKKAKTRTRPPPIEYNIVTDVLQRKADITVGDLMTASPALRRKLSVACRPRRIPESNTLPNTTMAVIADDDEDVHTTAAYAYVNIGDRKIKALIDCGAAKTCISKALADALGLFIDAASTNVFTLGNTTRQAALGLIYDIPIEVKNNMIIPCNVEVLPACPSHLIIGNNWLHRAKAKIDFNKSTLKVYYKNQKAELELSFIRKSIALPKLVIQEQTYEQPKSPTNSSKGKHVHFEEDITDESESEADRNSEESTEDEIYEEEFEDESDSLLVLEEEDKIVIIDEEDKITLKVSSNGLLIPGDTNKIITIKKPKRELKEWLYHFEILNPTLLRNLGYFDPCMDFLISKKSLEIRIHNRGQDEILLEPDELIGVIEKIDPAKDDIIQSYEIDTNYNLCVLETNDIDDSAQNKDSDKNRDEENFSQDRYSKLEIGTIVNKVQSRLKRLLHKYEEIFDWNNDAIGHTNLLQHRIIINENTIPISHRPYRISPLEAEHLQKELEKYSKLGVITPSNSPWAAPVILVKKKNGEYRMVIDYRKLNAVTKKDAYPLPRIDDLLDTLGKSKIFSALDMRAGFHQVPVEEESKELTAFTTKFGTYHYNTLPMGLVNSPATFQRLIDLCFRPLINKCLVAYIDDLNVYSLTHQEHLQHLEQVFQCIRIANLKLNPEKCFFFKDHLKFLGYIVTKEGLQTDPGKIQKIIDYPQPRTLKQVRGFLGLASYYRRFIKNFASIARPLHDQTKTTKRIPWNDRTTESFNTLKQLLTSAPILTRPDFNRPFILVTDASKAGLGSILTQLDDEGHEHPVVFASRGLKSSEVNYAPTKLECLAVIWAVQLFRPYLLGKRFKVITDHSALHGLLKAPNPTGIIARWLTILAEYDYEIKYRPGRVNESADFLSRLGY